MSWKRKYRCKACNYEAEVYMAHNGGLTDYVRYWMPRVLMNGEKR